MTTFLRFTALALLLTAPALAQVPAYKNSIRLGVNYTSLDGPDATGPQYVGRLARHIARDRVVVAAEAGYLYISRPNEPFNGFVPAESRRERFTADLTVLYNLLRNPTHALRLGAGGSAWYRRDDTFSGATLLSRTAEGTGAVAFDRLQRHGLLTGLHGTAEYAYRFTPRWSADARVRVVDLRNAGVQAMVGVGLNVHF